jgi:hypothetical protein
MLYETAMLLQRTDFNIAEEAEVVMEQISNVMDLFDKHTFSEESFVLPVLEKLERSVTIEIEQEHLYDQELANRLRSLLEDFKQAVSDDEKVNAGNAISDAFVEFIVFNLKNMAKEENVLNELLWNYFTDEQLKNIAQETMAHLPQSYLIQNNRWVMRAINNSEAAQWLIEVKNSAHGFAFEALIKLAAKELPPGRWIKVQENITEGALIA